MKVLVTNTPFKYLFFSIMQKKIKDGLPIDDIDKAAEGYLKKIKGDIGEEK